MSPRQEAVRPAHPGDAWPDVPVDDPVREKARRFCVNLREATAGLTLREVSEATGVGRSTLSSILRGDTWPAGDTVARLEVGLNRVLWPRERESEGVSRKA